ncbi:hypothetical protein RND71_023497 [Anisodus tanguticus]|uniref:Uncharacterized protein n=1 Tax=Anisodus tanguticus TaxID=243964 RepID=A0AAE1RVM9_9SOLA|nr:hypothetical protein RND71_023497 [Anisodus tanguticus]
MSDLDNFNQHSHGKSRLRFGMRLYNENLRNAAMHMSEDNQQLVWFKNQAAKYQKKTKALEETLSLVNMAFLYFGPGHFNSFYFVRCKNCKCLSNKCFGAMQKNLKEESSEMFSEPSRDYEKKDFLKSNWFHMLPKGVPISPSAPSDRHNYYVNPYP